MQRRVLYKDSSDRNNEHRIALAQQGGGTMMRNEKTWSKECQRRCVCSRADVIVLLLYVVSMALAT